MPATVVAEVGYLLAREAGARVESLFLQSLADGDFTPDDLTSADFARMADLVNTYESLPLGTTDASVVAVAERLGLTDVATLDRGPRCPETSAGQTGCTPTGRDPRSSLGRSAE